MAEKKCKFCAMMILKDAKICPHCGKKQGISTATSLFVIFGLIIFFIVVALSSNDNNSPGLSYKPPAQIPLTLKGQKIQKAHPSWSNADCNTIGKRQIYIGMSDDQVRAAWPRPYKINTTTFTSSTHEQWVMNDSINSTYLYFENGILVSMQESK